MKKTLLLTMILALTASVASAETLQGYWISDTVGAFNRYTLRVTSAEGTMTGFDLAVSSSVPMLTGGAPTFSTATDADTHFLFQKNHVQPPLVTDLAVAVEYEDATYLMGAFTATAGGIYAAGFTDPVNVLQLVVSGAVDPNEAFGVYSTSLAGPALARVGTGTDARLVEIAVPEPSVLTMLVLGLGALAFWVRRR